MMLALCSPWNRSHAATASRDFGASHALLRAYCAPLAKIAKPRHCGVVWGNALKAPRLDSTPSSLLFRFTIFLYLLQLPFSTYTLPSCICESLLTSPKMAEISKIQQDEYDKSKNYGEEIEKVAVSDGLEGIVSDAVMSKAAQASEKEVNMSVRDAFRRYPKSALFSIIFSTAIVMEGYDLVMINSFYAQPQFNEKFGQLNADGTYGLTAAWQSGLSNAVQVGSIIGLMLNGYLTDKFGYRRTMLGALFFM